METGWRRSFSLFASAIATVQCYGQEQDPRSYGQSCITPKSTRATTSGSAVRHIDLFSGIGGFALGFGTQPIAFCEIDAGCRAVLGHHWPSTPIYGDIARHRELPVSGPIRGGKASGPRRLEEFFDVRPDWVVVENVHHTWRRWVPELRREFHRIGFASVPLRVRAVEVGAQHERARVFVVAHADGEQLRELSRWWGRQGRQVADELARTWDSAPRRLGADDELPNWAHRRHALGNAVVINAVKLVAAAIRASVTESSRHE